MNQLRPKRVQTTIEIFSHIQKWINLFLIIFFFLNVSPGYTKDVALVYGHLCFLVHCFSLWLSLPLHSQVHGGDTWPPAPSAGTGSGRGMRIIWILTQFCLQKRLDMQKSASCLLKFQCWGVTGLELWGNCWVGRAKLTETEAQKDQGRWHQDSDQLRGRGSGSLEHTLKGFLISCRGHMFRISLNHWRCRPDFTTDVTSPEMIFFVGGYNIRQERLSLHCFLQRDKSKLFLLKVGKWSELQSGKVYLNWGLPNSRPRHFCIYDLNLLSFMERGVGYLQRDTDAAMTVRVHLKGAIEHRTTSQGTDGKHWL